MLIVANGAIAKSSWVLAVMNGLHAAFTGQAISASAYGKLNDASAYIVRKISYYSFTKNFGQNPR